MSWEDMISEIGGSIRDAEIPLKSLTIGLWGKKSREHAQLSALISYDSQKFVFLLDTTTAPTVQRRGIKRVLRHLTARSPFQSTHPGPGSVLAFEVEWGDIIGIDYNNPLCLPGRVVLESKHVVKHEYLNMRSAREVYSPGGRSPRDQDAGVLAGHVPSEASLLKATKGSLRRSPHGTPDSVSRQTSLEDSSSYAALERQVSKKRKHMNLLTASADADEASANSTDIDLTFQQGSLTPRQIPEMLQAERHAPPGPPPISWTAASARFGFRSISFTFDSSEVPGSLQPVIQDNERLLKLYEGGLPTWAIYAPQYGMWYRPWMRRITYMLFLLVSAFSLVMGFYDLYKNFPYLDGVLRRFAGQYFPIFAIRSWLDEHLSIRLSILFAYLFGKSELALQLLKWLGATGNVIKAALEPVNAYIGPLLLVVKGVMRHSMMEVGGFLTAAWAGICALGVVVFGPPLTLLLQAVVFLYTCCLPVLQVLGSMGFVMVTGPWNLMKTTGHVFFVWGVMLLHLAHAMSEAAKAAWSSMRIGAQIAPSVASSASSVATQASGWYFAVPVEAWDVVKSSTVKVVKALQTLGRLSSQLAGNISRHRLTLKLRLRRRWNTAMHGVRQRSPPWILQCCKWMYTACSALTGEQNAGNETVSATPAQQHRKAMGRLSFKKTEDHAADTIELPSAKIAGGDISLNGRIEGKFPNDLGKFYMSEAKVRHTASVGEESRLQEKN